MHIRKLAKSIGITTQELKKELQSINFGVKPDDTEIPEHLASGIVRVLGPKYKDRKLRRLEQSGASTEEIQAVKSDSFYGKVQEEEDSEKEEKDEPKSIKEKIEEDKRLEEERKKERERKKEEEKARKEKKSTKSEKTGKANLDSLSLPSEVGSGKFTSSWKDKKKKPAKKGISVTRKIELDPLEVQKSTKDKPKKKEKFKELTQGEIDAMTDDERLQYFAELEETKRSEKEAFKSRQKGRSKIIKNYDNQEQIKKKEGVVEIPEAITVKEFSEKAGVPVPQVIGALIKNGMPATINQKIDYDTAALVALDLDIEVKREIAAASAEELIEGDLESLIQDEKENLSERPPVVVVMGHVDHGKTSILDFYRKANVVAKEAGGITQHIGAYQIDRKGKKITFLDTPGHAAFTQMRARGARVTDLAILVVAADDGVKPQTLEAYNHAKEAGVSLIVAINKIDKPEANLDKVKGELAEMGLMPEDWGGDVPCIGVSAKTGEKMEDLIETVLLISEMGEFKANASRSAVCTIVESHLDKALGPVATVLVNTGTIKIKDVFIAGTTMGRVKSMTDSSRKRHKELGPSGVAQIAGFEEVPNVGDILQVLENEKVAREKVEQIKLIHHANEKRGIGLEEIQARIQSGRMNLLKVVLKVDSQGSLEAIQESLAKIRNEEVGVKVIHGGIGSVTETDVMMASASGGMVLGFHVSIPPQAKNLAEKEGVEIRDYKIIYQLLDEIKGLLGGMLSVEEEEIEVGELLVKQVFYTKKKMMIVGGKVMKGVVRKGAKVKVYRGEEEIGVSELSNLKSFQDDVEEVKEGNECGLQLNPAVDLQEEDRIKAFVLEKKIKTLNLSE